MAQQLFDENRWQKVIQKPDWYLEFMPYTKEVYERLKEGSPERSQFNKKARNFFEKAFEDGRLALASSGPDFDGQRQPIDTVVIHHTSWRPGYDLDFMNMTHLLNIYATYYFNPAEGDRSLKGQPIWSNHFRHGKMSFLGYHWLMRMDGSFERLLDDERIGWHAGNWDINTRSVGICLDNDYEKTDPSDEILRKLAAHIRQHYPDAKLIGHCQARSGTICPGGNFMGGWKDKLIEYLTDGT